MKLMHWLLMTGMVALALLPARAALASPDYPAVLEKTLHMPCAPPCTVCHRDNNGGLGTVVQPFGDAMRFEGKLQSRRPDLIPEALTLLEAANVDSDGDGVGDVDELRVGDDPNAPERSLCDLAPRYGCGAQVAPSHESGPAAWSMLALLVGLGSAWHAMGRRRRRTVSNHAASRRRPRSSAQAPRFVFRGCFDLGRRSNKPRG